MAAKQTTLKEVGETLGYIVEHMSTKEDTERIERELKSIREDLDALDKKVRNVIGYSKEIDHALERITAIEKHLGLNKKIAA